MYRDEIKNKVSVGMIEKPINAATSFVLSLEPSMRLRRSKKIFPTFLKISQSRATKMMMLKLINPKKKIELTKGKVAEIFERRNSMPVSSAKTMASPMIRIRSRFLFLLSSFFSLAFSPSFAAIFYCFFSFVAQIIILLYWAWQKKSPLEQKTFLNGIKM